jgi:hypothetical protein
MPAQMWYLWCSRWPVLGESVETVVEVDQEEWATRPGGRYRGGASRGPARAFCAGPATPILSGERWRRTASRTQPRKPDIERNALDKAAVSEQLDGNPFWERWALHG